MLPGIKPKVSQFLCNKFILSFTHRLDINLKSGKHEEATIPLHISVRFDEDIIIRNSYLGNGNWSGEEREDNIHDYSLNNPLIAGTIRSIFIKKKKK